LHSSPVGQWRISSGQFRVGSQSREALKFVFLFFSVDFSPLGRATKNGAAQKFVKWLQVGTGHGTWNGGWDWGSQSLSLSESQSGTGDRVSTAEQSAVASVPKHEKFSAAAAVRCSCR